MRVLVLHGVNLDVLGRRDPRIYGRITLRELEQQVVDWGAELGLDVSCKQTNAEGLYVEWIHDALELLAVPLVEVHLSAIEEREEFRRHSVVADLASLRVAGKGPEGYREALDFLREAGAT